MIAPIIPYIIAFILITIAIALGAAGVLNITGGDTVMGVAMLILAFTFGVVGFRLIFGTSRSHQDRNPFI